MQLAGQHGEGPPDGWRPVLRRRKGKFILYPYTLQAVQLYVPIQAPFLDGTDAYTRHRRAQAPVSCACCAFTARQKCFGKSVVSWGSVVKRCRRESWHPSCACGLGSDPARENKAAIEVWCKHNSSSLMSVLVFFFFMLTTALLLDALDLTPTPP